MLVQPVAASAAGVQQPTVLYQTVPQLVAVPAVSTVDRIVEMVPDLMDKVSGLMKKNQENTPETGEEF